MRERSVHDVLESGTIEEADESFLVVDVDGVELYVGTQVDYGDYEGQETSSLMVGYNRLEEKRIDDHGEADPLGLLD